MQIVGRQITRPRAVSLGESLSGEDYITLIMGRIAVFIAANYGSFS